MAEALAAVTSGRGSIATLILPHDVQTAAAGDAAPAVVRPRGYPAVDTDAVARAARLLAGAEAPAVLLGGSGLHGSGLEAAGRLGVTLIAEVSFARLETGRGRPPLRRLPYFPEQAQAETPRFRIAPLLQHAMDAGRVSGFAHHGRWTDVGTPERLRALDESLRAEASAARQ